MTQKRIFLIGMMGCGKSTLGPLLAKQFDLPFLDIDALIEQREGRSISQIFSEQGEFHFRQLEQQELNGLPDVPQIVACGGGLPCFEDNLLRLKQKGLVIYLALPGPRGKFILVCRRTVWLLCRWTVNFTAIGCNG